GRRELRPVGARRRAFRARLRSASGRHHPHRAARARGAGGLEKALAAPFMSSSAILAVSHVSKRFGGLRALDDVSLEVRRGEILGLIGPNGAGKTTLFSALVGLHRIDGGTIRFEAADVSRLKPHRIAALGLTKTFQNVALFAEMSVLDNVLVGGLLRRGLAAARSEARGWLERVELGAIADKRAGDL